MYRLSSLSCAAVLIVLVHSSAALALVTVNDLDTISIGSGGQAGTTGGPFVATINGDNTKTFDTYCLEIEETFSPGTNYIVDVSENRVIRNGPTGGTDKLTHFAAWLFTQWDEGHIADTVSNNTSVQIALWDEVGHNITEPVLGTDEPGGISLAEYDQYKADVAAWEAAFNTDVANGDWTGFGDVYVLNVWDSYSAANGFSGPHQDMIARILPGTQLDIPEPASLAVWAALGGIGIVLSRRRRVRMAAFAGK